MKNNTFAEVWGVLKEFKKVLISLHPKPDGDGLGSCAAMKYFLEKRGKEVTLISKDELSENLMGFSFAKEIEFGKGLGEINLKNFDVLVLLDHAMLDDSVMKLKDDIFTINIDHHHTNNYFGNLNYVDSKSPSCCSILVEFFQALGFDFDEELSRMLFLGICTDTYFFVHGNSLDSIKKAEFLIENGKIDYAKEFFEPINSEPWDLKKLHGILLSNMDRKKINGTLIAYSFVMQEDIKKYKLNEATLRLGIMCMQDLKDIPIVFTLTELKDNIRGSFRSKRIDTTLFSQNLKGGGHKQASAFYLEKMPMGQAIEKVLKVIEQAGIHKI